MTSSGCSTVRIRRRSRSCWLPSIWRRRRARCLSASFSTDLSMVAPRLRRTRRAVLSWSRYSVVELGVCGQSVKDSRMSERGTTLHSLRSLFTTYHHLCPSQILLKLSLA